MSMGLGVGGIGIGKGGARRKAFHFYVDSVSGSDANAGTTEATAFATLGAAQTAAIAHGNGVRIALVRNDLAGSWDAHWRDSIDLSSLSNVTLHGVGDPTKPLPKISAADIAGAPAFSLVAGKSKVHQITWTHEIGADYAKRKISAWKGGVRLKWVASVDLCEAEDNTFYVAAGAIANPATIYINTGGSNPGTGGDCEITAREFAVKVGSGRDVRNIHCTKQAHHDGAFLGGVGYGENILTSHGVVHNHWASPGSEEVGCVAYLIEPSTWRSGTSATQFITYDGDGSPEITTYRDCWAYSDSPAGNVHQAIYAHTNGGAARLGGIVVDGLRAFGPSPDVAPSNVEALSVTNSLIEFLPGRSISAFGIGAAGITAEVDNVTVINGARVFGSGAVNARDVRAYINGTVSGGVFFGAANTLRNSTFIFNPATTTVNSAMFNTSASAAEVTDCIISDAGERQIRAATAGSILSDRNVLHAQAEFGYFEVGASGLLNWTAWKTQTGQDAGTGATSMTGTPICADAPNGDFTPIKTIVDEGGRTAGSRKNIGRPNWSAMTAAWDAGFIAPVA